MSYPDGLTESAIDVLIAEVDAVLAVSPAPTFALVNGTAGARHCRRAGRQALASVVRVLPLVRSVSGPDEGEAA